MATINADGTFSNLSEVEIRDLCGICENLHIGIVPDREHPLIKEWWIGFNLPDIQFLLIISTVFPMKALLSVTRELLK